MSDIDMDNGVYRVVEEGAYGFYKKSSILTDEQIAIITRTTNDYRAIQAYLRELYNSPLLRQQDTVLVPRVLQEIKENGKEKHAKSTPKRGVRK